MYSLHMLLSPPLQQEDRCLEIVEDNAKSHKEYLEMAPRPPQPEERPAFSPRNRKAKLGPPRKPGRWETSAAPKVRQDMRPIMPAKRSDDRNRELIEAPASYKTTHASNSNHRKTLRMPQRRLSFEQDFDATAKVIERVLSELELHDDNDIGRDDSAICSLHHGRHISDVSAATI
ncbi:hypothetical protein MPSEU_000031300 [Mayamaea pseudoterrestris]|nr:hypothetical protein MPSEU_000031300 [Mayamaea pseudoterrestris]